MVQTYSESDMQQAIANATTNATYLYGIQQSVTTPL